VPDGDEAEGNTRKASLDALPEPGLLRSDRLALEPLRVDHAAETADLFDDERLHAFIGGAPATEAQLADRYARQATGWSQDRSERWFNWIIRRQSDDQVVGTVQATVTMAEDDLVAEVAWVVATAHQRQGYAKEAAMAMARWLRSHGIAVLVAHVHPDHDASHGVASALGLTRTGSWHDGEERWQG